jgi:hypothetical protein
MLKKRIFALIIKRLIRNKKGDNWVLINKGNTMLVFYFIYLLKSHDLQMCFILLCYEQIRHFEYKFFKYGRV